jgi:hypothetical protein
MDQASGGAFSVATSAYERFAGEPAPAVIYHMLHMCALRGDGLVAETLIARLNQQGVIPPIYAYGYLIQAHGWGGNLADMNEAAVAAQQAGHPVSLEV